jgi:hypothetical protein
LYATNLRLVPGASGAFIEHPLFVAAATRSGSPELRAHRRTTGAVVCADTIDRYFDVKLNLQMAATPDEQLIGGGASAFVGLPTDNSRSTSRRFAVRGRGPGPGEVAALQDLRRSGDGADRVQRERRCRRGWPELRAVPRRREWNATAAMGITQINSADDAELLLACNQIRTRLNFQNFDLSSVVLAVDPGNANHPVRFNAADFATFKSRINPWFIAERDAP